MQTASVLTCNHDGEPLEIIECLHLLDKFVQYQKQTPQMDAGQPYLCVRQMRKVVRDEDQYERCNNKEFDVNDSYKYPNDEHDCAKLKTRQIKNDFNQRKITISGIPENSIQEIKSLLRDYPVMGVKFTGDPNVVLVTLEDGEAADNAIRGLSGQVVSGQSLSAAMVPREKLLCIAHLPLDCDTNQLGILLSSNGFNGKHFFMHSEITGKSKGYCFLECKGSIEELLELRAKLDWLEYQGHKLHCDVVDARLVQYDHLHSQCLLIDNLPKNFKDVTALRQMSSYRVNPLYCQIATNNGVSLGYGIIEYSTAEEAEMSQQELAGQSLNNSPLHVTYCIPGKSAVAICNRLIGSQLETTPQSHSSLLPDPVYPHPNMLRNKLVKTLCGELPNLMKVFQTSLDELQLAFVNHLTTGDNKPGLLGSAPTLSASPLMNANLQLGLLILLALQMQSSSPQQILGSLNRLSSLEGNKEEGQDSTSADPVTAQANIILQNLMASLKSQYTRTNAKPTLLFTLAETVSNLNLNWLINLGLTINSMPQGDSSSDARPQPLMSVSTKFPQRSGGRGILGSSPTPLMPSPPLLQPGILGDFSFDSTHSSDCETPVGLLENTSFKQGPKSPSSYGTAEAILRNIVEHTGEQRKAEQEGITADMNFNVSSSHTRMSNLNKEASLLGCPPGLANFGKGANGPQNMNNATSLLGPVPGLMEGNSNFFEMSSMKQRGGGDTQRIGVGSLMNLQFQGNKISPGFDDTYNNQYGNDYGQYGDGPVESKKETDHQRMVADAMAYAAASNREYNAQSHDSYLKDYHHGFNQQQLQGEELSQQSYNYVDNYQNNGQQSQNYQSNNQSSNNYLYNFQKNQNNRSSVVFQGSRQMQNYQQNSYPDNQQSLGYQDNQPQQNYNETSLLSASSKAVGSNLKRTLATPVGQKRSYSHLLPPPEPSPEGSYVGQHSQGIGGHYADSYSKRMRLDSAGRY
ncbi:hypothetical protein ScPMuIL_000064 [Solemya velum]